MSDIMEKGSYVVKSGRRPSLSGIMADDLDTEEKDGDDWTVIEKAQIYTFVRPMGGMFLWLKVNFQAHPLFSSNPSTSSSSKGFSGTQLATAFWILGTKPPYLVLSSPGAIFSPNNAIREALGWQYFRLCFAACDEEDVAPLSKRFVESAQAFWRIRKAGEMRALLDEAEESSVEMVSEKGVQDLRGFLGPCC